MRIFDCFTFFNELDILKLRMHIMHSFVDYFVIVESDTTFSGNKKPFVFEQYMDTFKEYHDKIIHVKVTNMPAVLSNNRWPLEYHQRNAICRGLINAGCNDDDIIMVSDVDEIVSLNAVNTIKKVLGYSANYKYCYVHQPLYRYYVNNPDPNEHNWHGTVACLYSLTKNIQPQGMRNIRYGEMPYGYDVRDGGWHFTWLGGATAHEYKTQNFAHSENDKGQDRVPFIIPRDNKHNSMEWRLQHNVVVNLNQFGPLPASSNLIHIVAGYRCKQLPHELTDNSWQYEFMFLFDYATQP